MKYEIPFTSQRNKDKHLTQKSHIQGEKLINNGNKNPEIKLRDTIKSSSIFPELHRGRVAIFIDGLNLFHSALQLGIEIDYLKLLFHLTENSQLLRAFFYTVVDTSRQKPTRTRYYEKQQGFLFWMSRNGYRVVTKELQTTDNSKKPNLNVEIAVDMINLSPYYDTAVLVSGDGKLAYAVNAVTNKGARVEVVNLRTMTSDSLINIADYFIDLDSIKKHIQKDANIGYNYRNISNSSL